MESAALRSGKYAFNVKAQVANSLNQPLIPNKQSRATDSLSSSESTDDVEDEDERTRGPRSFGKDFIFTSSVALFAAGGVAASAVAMITIPTVFVFVMGGICILNSPVMALKQLIIAKNTNIRASINKIRDEAKLLKEEINFVTEAVDDLQAETSILKEFEQDLYNIAAKHRVSVDTIVDLVNENEAVLNELKFNMKQLFVQSLVKVVMRSDTDNSTKIRDNEVQLLSLRLQIQLEPYDIKLDQDKFEAMLRENNCVSNVLKFCGELLFEEDGSEDEDGDSVASEIMDLETFCKHLDDPDYEPPPMCFEEKCGMITINEKYSGGSVEVARGGRMTAMPPRRGSAISKKKTIAKEVKKRQKILADSRT